MNSNNEYNPSWASILPINITESDCEVLITRIRSQFSKELQRIFYDFQNIHNSISLNIDDQGFVDNVPALLQSINVLVRPAREIVYSCIITDQEVDYIASKEHIRWAKKMYDDGWKYDEEMNNNLKAHPDLVSFSELSKERLRFYRELIYTIPVILKNSGYEIFKPADNLFIKEELIEGIARAIHERYRLMMRDMDERLKDELDFEKFGIVNVYNRQYYTCTFEQLPEDIRASNKDSAFHIATKLLSIGYQIITEYESKTPCFLILSDVDIETMSKLEHERWAWEKRLKGFTYGEVRNDALKKHPCLVPYIELPELEKEKDRVQVRFYPTLLLDINYSVKALNPEQLKKISYIPLQSVVLQKSEKSIESVVRMISEENLIDSNDKKREINEKLLDAKKLIRTSVETLYAASQIQQCILPSRLYFRACLSNSFILHKPKDVLSGDFYFISKVHNFIILAVADCTGHGTSGAMLSMICSNYLDQAVNDHHLTDPSMIISYVYDKLINFMKRHDNTIISDYGMEISICNINTDSRTVYYAGINRPLILFRSGSLEILNPQKVRVGDGYHSIVVNIKASQQVNLNAGDTLYMLTDGYVDQIGGPDNKKFLSTNLIKTLESIQSKTMLEQFDILNCSIEEWKNQALTSSNEQTDDILVIGVRL